MPLRVQQGDWALREDAQGRYHLGAGPLNLVLTPLKGPVVHPPGYSGTPEVGRLYYQSVTRLAASGTVRIGGQARQVSGVVWLDHQWGDQQSGREALWDWFGLHLSDGSDLMLYRIRRANGEVVQVRGSRVDPAGAAHPVPDLVMTPGREWTSPSGRRYVLDCQVSGQGLDLRLAAGLRELRNPSRRRIGLDLFRVNSPLEHLVVAPALSLLGLVLLSQQTEIHDIEPPIPGVDDGHRTV